MSKKGYGPPSLAVATKPTPPAFDEAAYAAEAFAFPDATLSDDQPDILDLLSSALPDGLANPYAAIENGWAVGLQPVDPATGAPGASGPVAPYAGADVEALSGAPVGAGANAATGGPSADPYETSDTLEQLWTALGRTSLDMSQAVADNGNTVPAGNQTVPTATDASQAPPNVQTIALADGNLLVVGSNGVASVYDAQGAQIYNVFPLENGGGYYFQATDLSSPNTYIFNDGANANTQQPPTTINTVTIVGDTLTPAIEAAAQGRDLMAAILDAVSTSTAPTDTPPSGIAEVLGGTISTNVGDVPEGTGSTTAPIGTQLSGAPGGPSPTNAPYDPMAASPFARALLYGKVPYLTPALDYVTNDRRLQNLQNFALGVGIGAGLIATGGLLAEGEALGGGLRGAGEFARGLLADTSGAGTIRATGTGALTLVAGASAVLTQHPELLPETETVLPSAENLALGAGGNLPAAAARLGSLPQQINNVLPTGELEALGSQIRPGLPNLDNINFEPVTDPTELDALREGLNHFNQTYRALQGDPDAYRKAASAAGSYVHELFGAAGPGQGIDFVEGELKTHWSPIVDNLTLMSGYSQSLRAAVASGGTPLPVLHYVANVQTGQFVKFIVQPVMQ